VWRNVREEGGAWKDVEQVRERRGRGGRGVEGCERGGGGVEECGEARRRVISR